jgi:dTDP-4-amino-4,6-dideoxygalactose transaminase
MIQIAQPIIGEEEEAAVASVVASGMLAQGSRVAELEAEFARYCRTKYALAVNSGTAALHAALYAAGIRAGDEVITTPFSFIATINPILMLGARPVLVDIDPKTFNIDPKKIEAAITEKTKAIVPVHLYGQPANWDAIKTIADANGLLLIEDACQAVGATYKGKKTGSLGDLGCFSLYATKNMMCGEGGLVTTDNEEYANAIKSFRQHGMVGPYEYAELGYNYRMSDLHAAIAVEQLKKIDGFNERRRENAKHLSEGLRGAKNIVLPKEVGDVYHVYHQYTILLDPNFPIDRATFIERLKERGIGAGVYYPKPLHAYPHIAALGYKIGDFPQAEGIAGRVVSLPIHPKVSRTDIEAIVKAVQELAK